MEMDTEGTSFTKEILSDHVRVKVNRETEHNM